MNRSFWKNPAKHFSSWVPKFQIGIDGELAVIGVTDSLTCRYFFLQGYTLLYSEDVEAVNYSTCEDRTAGVVRRLGSIFPGVGNREHLIRSVFKKAGHQAGNPGILDHILKIAITIPEFVIPIWKLRLQFSDFDHNPEKGFHCMKPAIQAICKVLSGLAGACFLFAPLTFNGVMVMAVSGFIALAFAAAAIQLDEPEKPRFIKFGEKSDH